MGNLAFYLITGLSGAGKSTALQAFEDLGFFCVDNLPRDLVRPFARLCRSDPHHKNKVALALDIRDGDFVADFSDIISTITEEASRPRIIFLEAKSQKLINRYMESRRPHPLGEGRTLEEAIALEREMLEPIREESDMVIDTSDMNIHQFRGILTELHQPDPADRFTLSLTSFGFKHGVPGHLDVMFDARFLPNPYYEESLKLLSGQDEPVADFLSEDPTTRQYLDKLRDIIEMMIGAYYPEGKTVLSIGIGCTGGQHRSVFLVEELARHFEERGDSRTIIHHRDVKPGKKQ